MNFLGHLYLSDDDAGFMVGSLLPDLHRGPLPTRLHPRVLQGVDRHRLVDVCTDTHPAFAASRERIRSIGGRFSGVLVDIFYDHVLSVRWQDLHPQPLSHFIARAYRMLLARPQLIPPRIQPIIAVMASQNWLGSYGTLDGIALTLERVSRRLRRRLGRPVDLVPAVQALRQHFDSLADDFNSVLADVSTRVRVSAESSR